MKRKKGAQPGNSNARKRGFYSKVMSPLEKRELHKAVSVEGLSDEIALLRLKLLHLLKHEPDNLQLLFQATYILGRLVHINCMNPRPDNDRLRQAYSNVLREVAVPLGPEIFGKLLEKIQSDSDL